MQIPDVIRKCVAFLGCKRNSGISVHGTVFFVGYPLPPDEKHFSIYAVTARHVIEGIQARATDGQSYFRLNNRSQGVGFAALPLTEWVFHHDARVDVAIAPVFINFSDFDHQWLRADGSLTSKTIEDEWIGVGEEVFFPGLFTPHFGQSRNIPIVRTGNIAAMPEEPVDTTMGFMRAYLVEARSIGGLSGSPVFVQTGGMRLKKGGGSSICGNFQYHLLGLVHGHFKTGSVPDFADETSADGFDVKEMNMGIAIVVPIDDVRAALEEPRLFDQRKALSMALQQATAKE